jgi:hypothetical protein
MRYDRLDRSVRTVGRQRLAGRSRSSDRGWTFGNWFCPQAVFVAGPQIFSIPRLDPERLAIPFKEVEAQPFGNRHVRGVGEFQAWSSGGLTMVTIELSAEQRKTIAEKKVTCPFMGPVVRSGALKVHNSVERPLAAVDDIVGLGDSGGGDLGRNVLKLFAVGNHSSMPDASGQFSIPTPKDKMSLDLAGSKGAHPGHSGILLGDPTALDAGRFSASDFERLAKHADANGRISKQAIGAFIAENLTLDRKSHVLPLDALRADLASLFGEIGERIGGLFAGVFGGRQTEQEEVELREQLTKLAGEDNLIGSSGEFGLLFAFLAHRPEPEGQGDQGIRLADVEQMFVHHRLPDGWETWPKKASDWAHATAAIAAAAAHAYWTGKSKSDPAR